MQKLLACGCAGRCNGGIALQILLSRSYHHRHASFGDAAVHDDSISALQNGSEIIVVEEGATLDEGSKAPAEVLHGRKHWVAHEEEMRQELNFNIPDHLSACAGGVNLLHCCVFNMTVSIVIAILSARPSESLSVVHSDPC